MRTQAAYDCRRTRAKKPTGEKYEQRPEEGHGALPPRDGQPADTLARARPKFPHAHATRHPFTRVVAPIPRFRVSTTITVSYPHGSDSGSVHGIDAYRHVGSVV